MSSSPIFHRARVFRDPVHGLIPINAKDEFLSELIDTPEFQRLHRVRQLGVASMTFPGADHSRFCHSIGVMHIASRILEVLRNRYHDSSIANLVDKHRQTILAAALLHDIGHGPFSHLMERAFKSSKDHEVRTMDMITTSKGSVSQILKRNGINPDDVRQVIDHKFPFLFLQDIVSSQLDADRMDYLIRDSHFAGVDYGVFDLEWILNCFCVGSYAEDNTDPERWRLCLDKKRGLQAAEQLILARQHMSLQVYYHKSTRRWEAVFLCLIREAARLAAENALPANTPELVVLYLKDRGRVNHEQFLFLDEPLMFTAFALWRTASKPEHQWLNKLASGFLNRSKVLERMDLQEDLPSHLETLLRENLNKAFGAENSHWELDQGEFTPYKGEDPDTKKGDPEGYEDSVLATSILLSDTTTTLRAVPVAEVSAIFKTLIDQRFRLRRLFCDPKIKIEVDRIVRDVLTSNQLVLHS
ncbi:MAG: HD domain-containing protein [Verrucomicrobia bacterium]|nr:HD domain-containing protein [Verrucomicrobiota bacterium]